MFIRYDWEDWPAWEDSVKNNSIVIIDSEFVEIVAGHDGSAERVGAGVIDVYERRNLNVSKNLIRAFLYQTTRNRYLMADLIHWNRRNPKFAKYEKDIEKYLILA